MDSRTLDFLAKIEAVSTVDELWAATDHHLKNLGLTHSIFALVDPVDQARSRIWTQLPEYWQSHYVAEKHDRYDPYFKYCCNSYRPMRTGPDYLADYPFLSGPERQVIAEGGETGFRSGFAAPVRLLNGALRGGFGGWNFGTTLSRSEFERLLNDIGEGVWLVGFCVHERLQQLTSEVGSAEGQRLSPRERECLLWLSRGLRTDAIADRLGIARITVDLHFRSARAKLRAATREEALAKAIMRGLISP